MELKKLKNKGIISHAQYAFMVSNRYGTGVKK